MDALLKDARYALRMFGKNIGLTAVALLSLALGIGANTTIFSVVNAVLLRPLPYPQPEQLVKVYQAPVRPGKDIMPTLWSYPRFELLRDQNHSLAAVAACNHSAFSLTGTDEPERLDAEMVSASYFPLLGIDPIAGRTFSDDEDRKSGPQPVAVLGYSLWQRRFNGSIEALGKTIELDKQAFIIVGVMPAVFRGQQGLTQVWIPITNAPRLRYARILGNPMNYWFEVIGRLQPGVGLAEAQQEMPGVTEEIERVYPSPAKRGPYGETPPSVTLVKWRDANVDPAIRLSFLYLLAAAGFVLLIGCANIANLLLARAVARRKEIAVRLAVGASRGRIIRQLLSESILLAIGGGLLGLLLAMWGVELLAKFRPSDNAQFWTVYTRTFDFFTIRVDGRVLAFNFLLAALTGVFFGLVPALQASRPDLNEALKEGAGSASDGFRGQGRRWSRGILVAAQITLAFVLLAGAGLMVKTVARLQAVKLGFAPENVTAMGLSGRGVKPEFYQQILERVQAMPGVQSASIGSTAPLLGYSSKTMMEIKGRPESDGTSAKAGVGVISVSPRYFETLGIQVDRGRGFTERDRIGTPRVAVINRAAESLFPGEDPIGKQIKLSIDPEYPNAEAYVEIVGVADNVKYGKIEELVDPDVYLSALQPTDSASTLIVRATAEPAALVTAIRREALALDRNVPLTHVMTMNERSAEVTSRPRFLAILLGGFSGLALLLSAIGIYGVMTQNVAIRTREIGIRMALGASSLDVLRLVAREGAVLIISGLLGGGGAAYALTRLLTSQLYDVRASDPWTFALMACILAATALAACYFPARRATRVDPMEALRYQ